MVNLHNVIVTDVADLQKSEKQKITQKLYNTQIEKEMLKRKNDTLKPVNQQLTTQLNEKPKQIDIKEKMSSNSVVNYKPAKNNKCLLNVNIRSYTHLAD